MDLVCLCAPSGDSLGVLPSHPISLRGNFCWFCHNGVVGADAAHFSSPYVFPPQFLPEVEYRRGEKPQSL